MLTVGAEMPEDFLAIHRVNASAFERPNEAILADALRRTAGTCLSLVAVVVLGHPTYYSRFGFVPAVTKGLRCIRYRTKPSWWRRWCRGRSTVGRAW